MKKKIILSIITTLIMSFGMITKVNAIDIQPYWMPTFINTNEFIKTINNNNNQNNYFDTYINFIGGSQNINNNSKYIYFSINAVNTNNLITTTNYIDYTATCTHTTGIADNSTRTITYADGSQARITGTQWDNICDTYNNSGTTASYTENTDLYPKLEVYLVRDNAPYNTEYPCLQESGYFKCEMPNFALSKIHIKGFISGNTTASYKVIMSYWGYTTNSSVVSEIQQQTQQEQQNWNNFNNSDISSSSKTPADTTQSDNYATQENQVYNSIKQNPNELDILTVTLDGDTNSWIWNTINTLIAQHRYITILFVSIMTLGVAKQILGR